MAINIPRQNTLMDHLSNVGARYVENKAELDRERLRQDFQAEENERQRTYMSALAESQQAHEADILEQNLSARERLSKMGIDSAEKLAKLSFDEKRALLTQAGLNDQEIQRLRSEGNLDAVLARYAGEESLSDAKQKHEAFLAGPEMKKAGLMNKLIQFQLDNLKSSPVEKAEDFIKPFADKAGIPVNDLLTGKRSTDQVENVIDAIPSLTNLPGQPGLGFPTIVRGRSAEEEEVDMNTLMGNVMQYMLMGQDRLGGASAFLDQDINQ